MLFILTSLLIFPKYNVHIGLVQRTLPHLQPTRRDGLKDEELTALNENYVVKSFYLCANPHIRLRHE